MGAASSATASVFPVCYPFPANEKESHVYSAIDGSDTMPPGVHTGADTAAAYADQIIYGCVAGCNNVPRSGQTIQTNHLLLSASENGDVEKIEEALRNGAHVRTRRAHVMVVGSSDVGEDDSACSKPQNGYARQAVGMTPLMRAAHNGHTPAVGVLLKHRACPLEQEEDGLTALHFAAMAGSASTCKILVEAGANVKEADDKGRIALDLVPCEMTSTKSDRQIWESILAVDEDLCMKDVN
mmetsp:Transcript_8914/g.19971  ORF Transcript_8914/g.19971 Transcript_8914/m.19971 type:complete len:240 (-) Transcript_8914:80-799(-)